MVLVADGVVSVFCGLVVVVGDLFDLVQEVVFEGVAACPVVALFEVACGVVLVGRAGCGGTGVGVDSWVDAGGKGAAAADNRRGETRLYKQPPH